jgi:hypothetical protein
MPGLIADHSQQMQAVGVSGVDGQNLPVAPFGFGELSRMMVAKSCAIETSY